MKNTFSIVLLIAFSAMLNAAEVPKSNGFDYRITSVDYNPAQVIIIHSHYGFSTHIQFGATELVDKVVLGDKDAWKTAKTANHLFIKPTANKADTNMTVLTNKRTYNFLLLASEAETPDAKQMLFQVDFDYPDEKKSKADDVKKMELLKQKLTDEDPISPSNWNYWIKGSASIAPEQAFDDNRFTYLEFAPGTDLPAFFMEDEHGKESLINIHIKDNTVILHKVFKRLVLRRGENVACIVNKGYQRKQQGASTGSTDPDIQRVIRQ